jgi:NADH:ubiquinone oxidoreductase subunit F (NADH-binding)/(2Fe-2S) ferredoxin
MSKQIKQITLEKLNEIKLANAEKIALRRGCNQQGKREIMVCASTGCASCESFAVTCAFRKAIREKEMSDTVRVEIAGCFGLCAVGPIAIVYPEGTFYTRVKPSDVEEILESHIRGGVPVERLLDVENGIRRVTKKDITFYNKQIFIARNDAEHISPEIIDDYIAVDGYFALQKVLTQMTPTQVIDVVKQSGLRGRGGAGFPTGKKWDFAAKSTSQSKYIICNADEGDPGAFMDRSILESNPHAIIEAMIINGYAIGANQGYVYIRAEYPLAGKRLEKAIKDARELGLLGKNIFGKFDFELKIKYGAGAFVCGEETALIASIEGKRGEPLQKPPFPAVRGLFGQPTNINNVETYANIPQIILNGADWYRSFGTSGSAGTKVFAVTGKINHTGLVELPMGITLREVIYDVCGGIPNGKKLKAVQLGGPSGACIPESQLDLVIDYESLTAAGAMMGSGGIIVLDEKSCMVDVAKFFLEFTCDESCGKCTPCRVGNKKLLNLLEKISNGQGKPEMIDELLALSEVIKSTSLCGLGQTAPNPVISTIKHFRSEYEEHINNKRCPAAVCNGLVQYVVNDKCIGCGICKRVCPVNAITGEPKEKHHINQEISVRCGKCLSACPVGAIHKE